ncbi:hypothetical protein LOAG_00564 [Loa loa]|nr:hypothetical protein LOAG_00564 [Loa loa]EFO27927.1 hypothetical protein LOAG_00564 [Loa loa]
MADKGFRPLTAKEIRKHIERRGEDNESQQKQKKRSDDVDKDRSDDLVRKKCHEDDRLCDRKYNRKRRGRSVERHGDSRHRGDRHYDHGRETDSVFRERSSELTHSRERSRDQYSSREREDRSGLRGHNKESDSKQQRSNKSYERNRAVRRNRSSRHYSPEDSEDGSSDRPAWATKAVVKRAEEIQKRKLIWSKPEEKKELESNAVSSIIGLRPSTSSTWNSILAASSSDIKQLDKFKRLMGMKKSDEEGREEVPKVDDNQVEAERRRQRELYSHLDHQYAVARSFTHLSRGQGLGFHQ